LNERQEDEESKYEEEKGLIQLDSARSIPESSEGFSLNYDDQPSISLMSGNKMIMDDIQKSIMKD
jgi:hypothetical protein